jgi:hypothetical protein
MLLPTRREFLHSLGAVALLPLRQTTPDLILYNGNVITIDSGQPRAQAMALTRDRFLAVGTNDEIRNLASGSVKQIDLEGKTVVPGFIDAHSHPSYSGLRHLRELDCDLRSITEIQHAISARAEETPVGNWVLGFKYDDTKTSEGRPLTREDLDDAAPYHPVFITHRGGHTAYVNSLAFQKAGVDENTPDPQGGQIDRDPATGRLTGKLRERGTAAFEQAIPSTHTRDDHREAMKLISQMMNRTGVTSVHDAYGSPESLRGCQDAYEAGELGLRIYSLMGYMHLDQMLEAGIRTGLGNEWIKVGPLKLTCDGSISERTARLSKPYVGRPDDFGIIVADAEELYSYAGRAHRDGWQIGIHANGDVAIDMTLTLYEKLQKEFPRTDPRHRIEHCTLVNDSLIGRIKALGAIPLPFSTYVYYHGEKMREYGAERLDWMFAVRSFLDAGIKVTQTSDYPPGPFEPMMALQSSVTRTDMNGNIWGARQRVSVEEALLVGTLHGAYASFEENIKGSIEPGKLADLVVLEQDPTQVDPLSIVDIPIQRTMVGGRWVYEA